MMRIGIGAILPMTSAGGAGFPHSRLIIVPITRWAIARPSELVKSHVIRFTILLSEADHSAGEEIVARASTSRYVAASPITAIAPRDPPTLTTRRCPRERAYDTTAWTSFISFSPP